MKKIKDFVKTLIIPIASLTLPFMASAQSTPALPKGHSGGVPSPVITSVSDILNSMCEVFGWMFYFLITLSVIFIVIGAYRYLTSAGDGEQLKKANNTLIYAAISVAVALLAKGIPLIVGDFIGVSAGGGLGAC